MSQSPIASLLDSVRKSWPVLAAILLAAGWTDRQLYFIRRGFDDAWTLSDQMDWAAAERKFYPNIPNPNEIHRHNHPHIYAKPLELGVSTPPLP